MVAQKLRIIEFGDDVAVGDEKRLAFEFVEIGKRTRGAELRGIDEIPDRDAKLRAILEEGADEITLVAERHDDVADAALGKPLDDELGDGLAADGQQRLGNGAGERAQPEPFAAGHDHGSRHWVLPASWR